MNDEVETAAVELMGRVAGFGSAVGAIESGFQKNEIETAAYRTARDIDSGERVVVGLNRFTVAEEEPYEPLRLDPAIEAEQVARLAALRSGRDSAATEAALSALADAAEGTENVLYPMREALRAYATVGEVCNTLRGVWHTYRPSDHF
jgi:methylmalonyl-CoA mutase N-terminal domain/subunit